MLANSTQISTTYVVSVSTEQVPGATYTSLSTQLTQAVSLELVGVSEMCKTDTFLQQKVVINWQGVQPSIICHPTLDQNRRGHDTESEIRLSGYLRRVGTASEPQRSPSSPSSGRPPLPLNKVNSFVSEKSDGSD
eukprot:gene29574-36645_t